LNKDAALAMQEQERIAGEEAERRLKAALTAKREPSASASRVASPIRTVVGTAPEPSQDLKQITDPKQALELKPLVEDAVPSDDVAMESVDATLPLQSVDVRTIL
jgi:THO complex subunit 2